MEIAETEESVPAFMDPSLVQEPLNCTIGIMQKTRLDVKTK
jgi:hypothetical protein